MAPTQLTSERDVRDLIRGLTLLGTGGGGRPDVGLDYLLPHVNGGASIGWVAPGTIQADGWVCSVFGMGSIAPTDPLSAADRQALGYPAQWRVARPMVRAVQELEAHTGRPIVAIVPFELGAGNTAAPMDAAIRLGLPIVDGDCAGRAIPELAQTTASLAGIRFAPGAIVDPWGNILIVKETPSDLLAERIGKMISIATKLPDMKAPCAHAGFLMTGRDLERVAIPGGLTRALAVGRAIREAVEASGDPVAAAARALEGWVLFRGAVERKDWESRDGYMYGTVAISGTGSDERHRLRIWFKNEHHISWKDDEPWVVSPDLLMVMDSASGEPYTNTALAEGAPVGVVAARADAKLRTPAALAALGPRHYGHDIAYRPVEALLGARSGA
jgi:uncharacterized protein